MAPLRVAGAGSRRWLRGARPTTRRRRPRRPGGRPRSEPRQWRVAGGRGGVHPRAPVRRGCLPARPLHHVDDLDRALGAIAAALAGGEILWLHEFSWELLDEPTGGWLHHHSRQPRPRRRRRSGQVHPPVARRRISPRSTSTATPWCSNQKPATSTRAASAGLSFSTRGARRLQPSDSAQPPRSVPPWSSESGISPDHPPVTPDAPEL